MKTAIRVEGLSKHYRIGEQRRRGHQTLAETFSNAAASPWRRLRRLASPGGEQPAEPGRAILRALDDVNFEIMPGEVVGIIGRNGAGKSTLLKILSRITEPTSGRAELRGRVRSLLEVGTGFHPELTGRENIYLNGSIMGMGRHEITRVFDDIVDFAEIGRFLDTPVKRYSSGMYVRLAFAVAAHLEPEILVVDEVLSVGDASFQEKCLGKMGDVVREGRTILIVSHNLQTISTLCRRGILMDGGRVAFDGDTYSALGRYRTLWNRNGEGAFADASKTEGVVGARVITSEENQVHVFGRPLTFEFEIAFEGKPKSGAFSFQVVDEQSRPIVHLWLFDSQVRWTSAGRALLRCTVEHPRLYMGRYSVSTHLADRGSLDHHETLEGITPFEVVMDGKSREFDWAPGACAYIEDGEWAVV